MSQLFRLFLAITFLKKGPQDVPYSLFLFIIIFTLVFSLDIISFQIPDPKGNTPDFSLTLRYLVIANIIIIAAFYLIFKFHGLANRFLQSITAITGVELILKVVRLPINLIMIEAAKNESAGLLVLMFYLYLIMIIWFLVIYVHIFRQGLGVSTLYAGMLSLALFALNLFLNELFLPAKT